MTYPEDPMTYPEKDRQRDAVALLMALLDQDESRIDSQFFLHHSSEEF